MTDPGIRPSARRERGFTLLEIMIALAILAVGAVCVLSTFAAAIALHLRRESDVRTARVLEEARLEAQETWDAWLPSKDKALPAPLKDLSYSRDPNFVYSILWDTVDAQPKAADGTIHAVVAVVRISRDGEGTRVRESRMFLTRSGIRRDDLKGSLTWTKEREAEKMKKTEDPSARPKDR